MGFGAPTSAEQRPDAEPRAWSFLEDLPKIIPYLRPYWRLAVSSLVVLAAGAASGLLTPWPVAIVIDEVTGKRKLPHVLGFVFGTNSRTTVLVIAVVAGLVLITVQHALGVLGEYVATKLSQHMTLDLRSDLFQHAQSLSLAFHDEARSGALIYTINNAADAAGQISVTIPPLVQSALTLAGMFYISFRIDWTLALLSLAVVPFIYYSTGYYTRRIEPQLYNVRNIEHNSLTIVYEAMQMIRVIAAFGRERHEYDRFRSWAEQGLTARVRLTVRQTLFSMAVNLLTAAGTAAVLGVGAFHVLEGRLTAGELLVLMSYIAAVYAPLEQISSTLTSIQDQVISLRMAFKLLEREPEVRDRPDAVDLEQARGAVAYRDVGFSYSGRRPALDQVSFEVAPGQKVGIVGPTGAGKTTLTSLLPRFYDPQEGTVSVDGHDVRDLALASLRRNISIVHQTPLLFSGSIEYNIRYGRLEATEEDVRRAARAANAHDFIQRLPDGYQTQLGEGGAQLSGGERQRIAIARAFLKDAPILILDEPTAAVDSRTEEIILNALDRLMEGHTTFVVAHRLSTLRSVDVILVIDRGTVRERGTHEELLARGGLYATLHEAQTRRRSARRLTAPSRSDGLAREPLAPAIAAPTRGEP
jgi:ATP-binding cassette, subfamily B, bacterial